MFPDSLTIPFELKTVLAFSLKDGQGKLIHVEGLSMFQCMVIFVLKKTWHSSSERGGEWSFQKYKNFSGLVVSSFARIVSISEYQISAR